MQRISTKIRGPGMLTLTQINEAGERLAPYIYQTPLLRMSNLDAWLGCRVYIKAECMQKTNSFKIRGALNKMLSLPREALIQGVVAASSGNHGKGVAFAAALLGVPATVVLPDTAPRVKVEGIRKLGARVVSCRLGERHRIAGALSADQGSALIHPYDDEAVMAGQGTAGAEIMAQLPEADAVVAPVGGGGLISGVSTAVKGLSGKARVIGVEPELLRRYARSIEAGEPVALAEQASVADAVLTLEPGHKTFPIARANVDRFVGVSDEYILKGQKLLLTEGKVLAEPSSAMVVGAVLQGAIRFDPNDQVCFLISGGNTGLEQIGILKEISL